MIINNRETAIGDRASYIDQEGNVFDATIANLTEHDGNAYADLEVDGQSTPVTDVPYNTSPEKHSWKHAIV